MITKYQSYNESIRDKMSPKSKEEIEKSLGNIDDMSPFKKIKTGSENNILWLVEDGLKDFNKQHREKLFDLLMDVTFDGYDEIVKVLLDYNAHKSENGFRSQKNIPDLLIGALNGGHLNVMKQYIEHGFDIDKLGDNMEHIHKNLDYPHKKDIIKLIVENSPKVRRKLEERIEDIEEKIDNIKKVL